MVKAYLRYEHARAFGVISSGSNALFDDSGSHVVCAALESVAVWSVKTRQLARRLTAEPGEGSRALAEVARVAISGRQLGVGHADGCIRLWGLESGECAVTLRDHRKGVTALRYSRGGGLLASGSKDTDVIVWDVVAGSGVCRLRGHRDQVTDLAWLGDGHLASCSKDAHIRVWDMATQHCCQTLWLENLEVWSMDVDPFGRRLVAGCVGRELQVFSVSFGGEDGHGEKDPGAGESVGKGKNSMDVLQRMGSIERLENDRVVCLRFRDDGAFLVCQGSGKVVEVLRVRPEAEALKRLKRRRRRAQKKASGRGTERGEDGGDGQEGGAKKGWERLDGISAPDEFERWRSVRLKHRLRSFDFRPQSSRHSPVAELLLTFVNNSFELVKMGERGEEDGEGEGVEFHGKNDMAGHRSGIRSLALSEDESMVVSTAESAVKVWNPSNGTCLHTIASGYGLSCLFAPGGRHIAVGTKEGALQIFNLGASCLAESVAAHSGPVWSLAELPDRSGFVSGSADHSVKFWQWDMADSKSAAGNMTIKQTRQMGLGDDVLCVCVSPDSRLLAVALLDSTVKVFYMDSLKLFLSLYGHKLPVLSLDISSDSQLLVSGSADKNIKIWGLDFGDCHKSLFAHRDSVTHVAFVHTSHYVFSTGKDKMLKYWDADKFEQLLELPGHHAEVWCMAVSRFGDFVLTGSNDRSIRRWERTDEPFFIEEEKEKRLETLFEEDLEDKHEMPGSQAAQGDGKAAPAGRQTLESITAADSVIEALELASHETLRLQDPDEQSGGRFQPNPLLLGMDPSAFVLKSVSNVKTSELETALMCIPFMDALRLLDYLCQWLENATGHAETICRVAILLVRLHQQQLSTSSKARLTLVRLQPLLRGALKTVKDTMGFNMAGIRHMQRTLKRRKGVEPADQMMPVKQKMKTHD
eukprot:evm.model.scf_770.6 EVM.evm.TU.scf_770.6   scf_770:32955-36394(+)